MKSPVRCGCSPNARQIRCTPAGEIPARFAGSRLDQCAGPLRDLLQGPDHDLLHLGTGDGARRPRALRGAAAPGPFSRMRRSSSDSTSGSSLGSALTPADRTRQPGESTSPDPGRKPTHVVVKELKPAH